MQRRETMSSSPSSRRGMNIQSSDTQVWPSASLPPSTQALKPRPEALTTDADSLHPAGWKSKMEADLVPGGSHFLGHSWLQACAPHPTPTLAAPPSPPPPGLCTPHRPSFPFCSAFPALPPPPRIPWLPQRETPQDRPGGPLSRGVNLMEMRAGVP